MDLRLLTVSEMLCLIDLVENHYDEMTDMEKHNVMLLSAMQHPGLRKNMFGLDDETMDNSDIKISRWPDGKHYYASYKGQSVITDKGKMKWDTYKAAYAAAIKFKIKTIKAPRQR